MKKLLAALVLTVAAVASAQKAATSMDAATCFKFQGVNSLYVARVEKDNLDLISKVSFSNFTGRIFGADKVQDIVLKDLDVNVYLVDDITQPKKRIESHDADGKLKISYVAQKTKIGSVYMDELRIGKGITDAVLKIGLGQITQNGNGKDIVNEVFNKLTHFFNLLNCEASQRKNVRIIFEGKCNVTVLGENNARTWISSSPVDFEWLLVPSNKNEYLLEPAGSN